MNTISFSQILDKLTKYNIKYLWVGDVNRQINSPKIFKIDDLDPNSISWVSKSTIDKMESFTSLILDYPGILILPTSLSDELANRIEPTIYSDNPRYLFLLIMQLFAHQDSPFPILPVITKENTKIGAGTIIEPNCIIGENCKIGYNNVILSGTVIENNVIIGSNNTIGGTGFGYENDENGDKILMPHIGGVIIKKNVEIGNNTCIDRAVMGNTIIGENCKIDNLVHIAHGVVIGKNSLVIANAMIAGSCVIGENCWIAPSASIINKANVGDNSFVGMSAAVIRNVEPNTMVAGVPAKTIGNIKTSDK